MSTALEFVEAIHQNRETAESGRGECATCGKAGGGRMVTRAIFSFSPATEQTATTYNRHATCPEPRNEATK